MKRAANEALVKPLHGAPYMESTNVTLLPHFSEDVCAVIRSWKTRTSLREEMEALDAVGTELRIFSNLTGLN